MSLSDLVVIVINKHTLINESTCVAIVYMFCSPNVSSHIYHV